MVDGTVNTLVLGNLSPLTEYIVKVYSVVGEKSSEPLDGTETTCKCTPLAAPPHQPLNLQKSLRPLCKMGQGLGFHARWAFSHDTGCPLSNRHD